MDSVKSYALFMEAIRMRESSGNYQCKNKLGYLGAYQFGLARLSDFRLTVRVRPGSGNDSFAWQPPFSEEKFLNSSLLQDAVFGMHVQDYVHRAASHYMQVMGKTFDGALVTLSGFVACCHLLGEGGFRKFIAGENTADAFGTTAKDYIVKFAGYDIPAVHAVVSMAELAKYVA